MLRRIVLLGALIGGLNVFLRAQASSCGANQYDCAVFSVQHKQFQEAISTLTDLVRQSPGDLKALNLLGIAFTETGQIENANAAFSQALTVNLHFFPARKNLAINEFNRNRYAEAATQFKEVLKDAPNDDVAELYLGEINFRKSNFAAACTYYEKGRAKIALQSEWTLHFADCLLKAKRVNQATAVLRLLPEKDGQDRFDAGVLLGKAEAYEPAAEFFGSTRKRYRDPYAAGYNQVLMLIKADKTAEAIQAFQELTSEGYKTAELYNLAAEAYLKSNQVQEAYDAMRAGTQIDPKSEDNYVDLASICLEHEEYSLATDILDVGTHYVPDSYRMHIQRGVSYVMRGAIDKAESDFETAATLAPDKSLPYLALSWVWIESGKTAKAVEVLRQKWKEPNFDYLVPYAFGVALVRSGVESGSAAGDEAITAFELSVSRNSKFSHSHSELGKLLFKNGETDRAISELKIATALDPDDSGPFYVLAQAYRKKGLQAEAKQMLARVSQLHSEEHNLDLKKQLIRLVRQDAGASSQAQGTR
jgi:tetratricopeptide (TPR) repeat protein